MSATAFNVVDSCGWLEYFAGSPHATFFAPAIEKPSRLIVPVLCLYEVSRRLLQEAGHSGAVEGIALMRRGLVVPLDERLALSASGIGHRYGIPMPDACILATAQAHRAIVWTQDADFQGLPGVKFHDKRR